MYPRSPDEPDIFFPRTRTEEAKAKGFCLGCPVKNECNQRGDDIDAVGIWGGNKRSKS